MYPGSRFEIIDQSKINPITLIEDSVVRPVFMTAITADKGTEDLISVKGSKFFKHYGDDISFAKHGQPLLQAANAINAGGQLYVKRVVASDSTLANIGVVAKLEKVTVAKTNTSGAPLYTDAATGLETTTAVGNTPITVQKCKITYELKTISTTGNDINALASTFLGNNAHTNALGADGSYLLFVITEAGRGTSKKKFRITPDYNSSRTDYTKYIFEVLENNIAIESLQFAMNTDIIEKNKNISLQNIINEKSIQVRCRAFEDEINSMIENICYITGDTAGTYAFGDILYGKDVRGKTIDKVVVDTSVVDLRTIYGIDLVGGTNGAFGDSPLKAISYASEVEKVFNGTFSDEIYNLDNVRIDLIVDANYPAVVKRAIEGLASFREDLWYFRDLGLGLKSIAEIAIADSNSVKNKFCGSYHNSYDIIDPYSKKQITVSIGYSLVRPLVSHFLNGRSRPFAGILYGVTFPEVIAGTVNFVPKITPAENQKNTLDNMRVNYASFFSDLLVMETLYTSQDDYTQLSFLSNVLSIQEVIKAVREKCPKIRYTFLDGDDLATYQKDVQAVIDKFVGNFLTITLEYVEDATYTSNKIFYAVLKVSHRNFVQAEFFKVIVLPS